MAETQLAACNEAPVSPVGTDTIVGTQLMADPVSTSGTPSASPTAVQVPLEAHDTPQSNVQLSPLGAGGDSGRHAVPDRLSIRGAVSSKDVG